MVTTVTGTKEVTVRHQKGTGLGPARPNGNGGRKNGGSGGGPPGGGGGDGGRERPSLERYRIGVLVGMASILMMFTALASAYVVRAGLPESIDWRTTGMPSAVLVSTVLILASSATMTLSQRAARRGDARGARTLLAATFALGLGFLASQVVAWRQLVAAGVYVSTNPHSSFFYVLTGLHAIHLAGGLCGLGYLLGRARRGGGLEGARGRALGAVVSIYWHFMDGLWVFLFLLLFFWR